MGLFRTKDKVVFYAHVPRCGGSSIESVIQDKFGKLGFLDHRFRKRNDPWTRTSPQHVTMEALKTLLPPGFVDHAFAVVRHPADRVQSVFLFQRDREKKFPAGTTFSEALQQLRDPAFRNDPQFDNHFRQQAELVPKSATVFKLENGLDAVMAHIAELAGETADAPESAPRLNAVKAAKVDLTAEEHALLEEIYAADYSRFGYERYQPPVRIADIHSPFAAPKAARPTARRIAIKADVPNKSARDTSGDWHFANSLMHALRDDGHEVRVDCVDDWQADGPDVDVNLSLRGHRAFDGQPNVPTVVWLLYPGRKPKDLAQIAPTLQGADHIAVSSIPSTAELRDGLAKGEAVSTLLQCFDRSRMYENGTARSRSVFVGNNLFGGGLRPIVRMAMDAGDTPRIFGGSFEGSPAADLVEAPHIANEDLGDLYRSSACVLCDHMPAMRAHGYVSNRIFDALACGTHVISDTNPGIPVEFDPYVHQCRDAADYSAAHALIAAETEAQARDRAAFAESFSATHSFESRARELGHIFESITQ